MSVHEELEDFELAVEQLEEAVRLARIDSPLKCRRALDTSGQSSRDPERIGSVRSDTAMTLPLSKRSRQK